MEDGECRPPPLSGFGDCAAKAAKLDVTNLRALKEHIVGQQDTHTLRGTKLAKDQEDLWNIFLNRTSNGFVKVTHPPSPQPSQPAASNDLSDSDELGGHLPQLRSLPVVSKSRHGQVQDVGFHSNHF